MNFKFAPAKKEKSKLRLAVFGPSGSGKTYTGLRMATGMGGKIAFIDTERGSASKYADRFEFDVLELDEKDINTYVQAISAAAQSNYPVLIIDSLTHAWHELLDEVEKIARAKYRGNTWSAWSEGTPKQRKLVDALLDYPGHIIATMRTKTEWTVGKDSKGRTKPERVGLAPEQGKGIEYEFDLLMELTVDHDAKVIKDRTGKFQDKIINMPGEDFGTEIIDWLNDGVAPSERREQRAKAETTETKKNGRPLSPEDLKRHLAKKASNYTMDEQTASKTQRGLVAGMLGTTLDGVEVDRHAVTYWLTEGTESVNDLSDGMVLAMLDWLDPEKTEDGYVPSDYAIQEARAVLKQAGKDQGQQEMELD